MLETERRLRRLQMSSEIRKRAAKLGHHLGTWRMVERDGFSYIRYECTKCGTQVYAEMDFRLLPADSSALKVECRKDTT